MQLNLKQLCCLPPLKRVSTRWVCPLVGGICSKAPTVLLVHPFTHFLEGSHSRESLLLRTGHTTADMALTGKVAVVTGAAMGIGKAMTEILMKSGAKVRFYTHTQFG